MKNILWSRGKLSLAVMGTIATSTAFTVGLGWSLIKTVALGEQAAAVVEWQKNTDKTLADYQESSEKKIDRLSDDVIELKITSGTTKELVKLISDRYQINTAAVEARVKRDVGSTSSTIENTHEAYSF